MTNDDDKTIIIIRKIPGGWRVLRDKNFGLEKGEVSLATTCDGNLGKVMAIECAKAAATLAMADEIVLEMDADDAVHTRGLIDAKETEK